MTTSRRVVIDEEVAGPGPSVVVWDVTYACPLRCGHCYSESGRRPARQLGEPELTQTIDAILALGVHTVVLSGGEPLVVPGIAQIIDRLAVGARVHLYTGGWHAPDTLLERLVPRLANVTVSIDGARPATHDRLRGRRGSHRRALDALARIHQLIASRAARSDPVPSLGVDVTVTRSGFDEMDDLCELLTATAPGLDYLFFGAVMPIGLASRQSFADTELLTPDQLDVLRAPATAERLKRRCPPTTDVVLSDNYAFQMHPDSLARGEIPALQIEPDGRVRAMPIYEGTIGNVRSETGSVLWRRVLNRWNDPGLQHLLRQADTPSAWAEATRQIDVHFGDEKDRARIAARPAWVSPQSEHPKSGEPAPTGWNVTSWTFHLESSVPVDDPPDLLAGPAVPPVPSLNLLELPEPDPTGRWSQLNELIDARASRRAFSPMTLDQLGALLWPARNRGPATAGVVRRGHASGGSAHSLELYVVVAPDGVRTLPAGAYRYRPDHHALQPLDVAAARTRPILDAVSAAVSARPGQLPAATLLVTSRFSRVSATYGGALGYRLVLVEAGGLFQSLALTAEAVGLAWCPVAAATPPELAANVLGLDAAEEPLIAQAAFGAAT